MKYNGHQQYNQQSLNDTDLDSNPINALKIWLEDAKQKCAHYSAFNLSTGNSSGRITSRIVLLKEIDKGSLIFFSNYNSLKGKQIAENPLVAATFFWGEMERQVRIEGEVKKVSEEKSQQYFNSRPTASKWAAMASNQSEPIEHRENLEAKYEKIKQSGKTKRPENWGGYAIEPHYFEFWQGRESRLNDRIVFEKVGDSWKRYRLQP